MFAARGAVVLQSDAIGRELMQPGQTVYALLVKRFGAEVVLPRGQLDRAALARVAFEQGQVEALNAIIHPAVIAAQEERMRSLPLDAVVIVESALIFETRHAGPEGWRKRFDRLILVTAPEPLKIARFLDRAGATAATRKTLEAEARRRLAAQMPDEEKVPFCDYVLHNDGNIVGLEAQVERVWQELAQVR
jgi:dephospho-CoA kinase